LPLRVEPFCICHSLASASYNSDVCNALIAVSQSIGIGLFFVSLAAAADAVIDVGSRKQLLTDHKFIQASEGIEWVMNPPVRTGEVLVAPDAPWEKNLRIGSYSTVVSENGRVRLWYNILGKEHEPGQNPAFMGVAYAESTDGIHFTKPLLNQVEFENSRQNNLVLPVDPKVLSIGGGSVMKDENPNCPPEELYKSWQKIYPKKGSGIKGPYRVWISPDGLRWKLSERLVTGLRAADTQPSWFWDSRIQRYIGYSREWVQFAGEGQIRMGSYNESDDMHTWEKTHIALEADETDAAAAVRPLVELGRMKVVRERLIPVDTPARASTPGQPASADLFADQVPPPGAPMDIYGPGVIPYTEADGIYISLMSIFHHWGPSGSPDTADVRLGVSRDARHFFKPGGRKPFLGVGPAGAFDSKWVWALPRPIRVGDELWVYYFGSNMDHGSRGDPERATLSVISRAIMRVDGFVSADFDYTGGTLITPPIRFQGSRLELNLDTGAGGLGRVEILNESGEPIPGYSMPEADRMNGNNVRAVASWKGKTDVAPLAGKAIRLHLKMRSAKLYAFQFR
jgi:hypothetical protein